MALLTEDLVRQMSNNGTRGPVVVNRNDVLTPSARSYLLEHRVEVVYPHGGSSDPAERPRCKASSSRSGAEVYHSVRGGAPGKAGAYDPP